MKRLTSVVNKITYTDFIDQVIRVFNIKYCDRDICEEVRETLEYILVAVRRQLIEEQEERFSKMDFITIEGTRVIHNLNEL